MVTSDLGQCEGFVFELRRSNLIDRGRLDQVVGEFLKRYPQAQPEDLAAHLVEQGALTDFQAERVMANKAQGLVLGPYVLTDALGSGSMGTVYKSVSKTDGKEYAVKVLPRRSMWNVRLARRQVRSFAQFNQPSVVPFVDVGTSGGMHYLVWPFVSGETLEKLIERVGQLTPAQTARIGVQVANALAICHGQNIFHGLLKPSNILLRSDLNVAILDFGIGSLLAENEGESLVDTMSTANTLTSGLDCASPESILEPTNRTPAGDQYSLGCVLYYCVTGRYPFADGSAVEKMIAHQSHEPTALNKVVPSAPDELVAVVERLMKKKPDDRFRGADEVAERLAAIAGDSALPVPDAVPPCASEAAGQRPNRPSSLVIPPALFEKKSAALKPGSSPSRLPQLSPTPTSHRSLPPERPAAAARKSSSPIKPVVAPFAQPVQQASPLQFVMPPGFVPEPPSVARFGPWAVAAVGVGAMILSYFMFMTFNPFR
jgi:serine/threonine-protein kinase